MSNTQFCCFCNSFATVQEFSPIIALYECPLCGKYFVDTSKIYEPPLSEWRKILSSFLFYNKLSENTYYFIGEQKNIEGFENLESKKYKIVKVSDELLKEYMNLSFSAQMDKFLVYLADKCECAGIGKDFCVKEIYSAAFVRYYNKDGNYYSDDEQSRQYASIKDYLEKQKQYVKFSHSFSYENENKINISLTPAAFEYLDELKKNVVKNNKERTMYNILMYEDKKKRFCCEFDINSKETVLQDYVIPYLSGQSFFLDGVELTKDKISKIIISQTKNGIDEEVQNFRLKHKGSGVIILATRENVAQDDSLVTIVTNEFLNEAKKMSTNSNNGQSKITPKVNNNKVFIVYGHDENLHLKVTDFIRTLGLTPIILSDEPNRGMTIIEKLQENSDVTFAIVLYTPDDNVQNGDENYKQPRPNVIFEYGYFMGLLGREKIALLVKDGIKGHTDIDGTGYIKVIDDEGWKLPLIKELCVAGYEIDLNKLKKS